MPCDSSHCEPTLRETESSRVCELLRETRGVKFDHQRPKDYYGNVERLDEDTAALCAWCQAHDVAKMSLELQMWWRDHQVADQKKATQTAARRARNAARRHALEKLTATEKRVLGVDSTHYDDEEDV